MKKHYFIDTIHIMTDYMGGWSNQWKEVGWYDDRTEKYFNPDEVKEIFLQGQADNVNIDEDGNLYMEKHWLDARTAFSIICGIPFGVTDKYENLLSYAKKEKWITETPIPIQMYSGTKTLQINDNNTYTIKYTLDKNKYNSPNIDFIRKICVGKINKLKNSVYLYCHDGIQESKNWFTCGEVIFDSKNLTLVINDIPYSEVYKRELIDVIRNLDLELLVSNRNIVNFSNVLSACKNWCRDCGQYHWIDESPEDKNSNIYWYDK